MPTAASSIARPPNTARSHAPIRAAYSDAPIVSVIVWTSGAGRLGSSARNSRRRLPMSDAGGSDVRT